MVKDSVSGMLHNLILWLAVSNGVLIVKILGQKEILTDVAVKFYVINMILQSWGESGHLQLLGLIPDLKLVFCCMCALVFV